MTWREATLADVAKWASGGTPRARDAAYYGGTIPWAVIGDLSDGPVRETASTITAEGLANSSAKIVPAGTVLVAMYGSIGKLGIAAVPMATNQAIATAVPNGVVDAHFLFWYLASQRKQLDAAGKGAAQRNISQSILKLWPIRFPDRLNEQRRIVETLEEHLSRLDAADGYLAASRLRRRTMVKSVLLDLIPDIAQYPAHWETRTVGTAGKVELGRQRHPDWHTGPNMHPYLRVANVFEDRIDDQDVKQMHWPDGTFERFRLHPGDVLLNEGQTPDLLGRPALYRGQPEEVAFTNSLLRFQADDDVMPEFALLVFRRHMHAGRFKRESRITTNIAHLSASRLKPIEFPVPPIGDQERIVAAADERLDGVSLIAASVRAQEQHSAALRRALLAAAFSGRLTGKRIDDEVIEELAQ